MADVFISYSSKDRELAKGLASFLIGCGYGVWMDTSLTAGKRFDDEIEKELTAARAVIVIWTPNSAASHWVREEARQAMRDGKLIAARIESLKPARDLPLDFRSLHADLVTDRDSILRALEGKGVTPSGRVSAVGSSPDPEMIERLEQFAHWSAIKDSQKPAELREFLIKHPRASLADLIRDKLRGLEQAEAEREAEARQAAERRAKEAADLAEVVTSKNEATMEALLRDRPYGPIADAARMRLAELRTQRSLSRRMLLMGAACSGGLIAYLAYLSSVPGTLVWRLRHDRSMRTFTGHTGPVRAVALAPDGRTALSGSADRTLKLWDVATGRQLRTFTGHTDLVEAVAFAPDGHTALSGSTDSTLRLWDVATGRELRTLAGDAGLVQAVAFAPDGRSALSGSTNRPLNLWDVATGQKLRTFAGSADLVQAVAFAPDGRSALSGSPLKLWDVWTGKELRTFGGGRFPAFAPGGRTILSISGNHEVDVWDVATGGRRTFTPQTGSSQASGVPRPTQARSSPPRTLPR